MSDTTAANYGATTDRLLELAFYAVLAGTLFSPLLRDGGALALVALLIARKASGQRTAVDQLRPAWRFAIAAFLIADLTSLAASEDPTTSAWAMRFYPIGLTIFVGAFHVVRRGGFRRLSQFVLVLVLAFALDTLWQVAHGESLLRGQHPIGGRFMGSLVHPTNISLLVILLPIGLASFRDAVPALRWLYGVAAFSVVLAVAASGTRAAWLGLFGFSLAAGWTSGVRRFGWALVCLFLVASITAASWGPFSSPRRLLLVSSTGEAQRLLHWRAAAALFAERPLLGHGPLSFRRLCVERHRLRGTVFSRIDLDQTPHPHSLYWEALVGGGIFGLAVMLLPFGLAFHGLRGSLARTPSARAVVAGLGIFLMIGLVDLSFMNDWVHLAYWLPIALAAGFAGDG